jgi:hypothetical protein
LKYSQGKTIESQYKIHSSAIEALIDYVNEKKTPKAWQLEMEPKGGKADEENCIEAAVEENDGSDEGIQCSQEELFGGEPKMRGLPSSSGDSSSPQEKKRKKPAKRRNVAGSLDAGA